MDLTNADCALGRLVWNLWSLEWMLRNVLYLLKHAPHTDLPHSEVVFMATIGSRLPENALTSSPEQRQRLQQLFFPHGVVFDGKTFVRTGVSTNAFKYLTPVQDPQNDLACPAGFESDVFGRA